MSQRPAPRLDLMPSAADRWMVCSASPRFCLENADLIPADSSSKFSNEGTTAHEVAAAFLQNREPNPANCPTPINAEMRRHAWEYAEYVEGLRSHAEVGMSKLIVEQKEGLWYYPGRNAVVDAAVINPESLHIVDLKYGAGVPVSPDHNLQCTIYARQIVNILVAIGLPGAKLLLDFPIFVHIYQPRCRGNEDTPAQVWETTWGEIKQITDEIADHAQVIQINHKVQGVPLAFAPSEKACRWCPAKAICPARQDDMLDGLEALAIVEDERKPLPPVKAISVEQLAAVLKHKSSIEKWLKDAAAYAEERMGEGHTIPGFKLVLSRGGNRYWSDPKAAEKLLTSTTILKRAEVIEENLISPAQVEKLLGKKKFSTALENLIAKAPGTPTIAPADDPREECTIRAENEFTAIPDNADFE